MKQQHIFLLLISFTLLDTSFSSAQTEVVEDSLIYEEQFSLRVGVDISKPIRHFFDEDYRGIQLLADYRIYEDYYIAAEIGSEKNLISEANVLAIGKGSYAKIGGNYNVYNNWRGMQNLVFVGLRYGFSSFSTELLEYSIYSRYPYFEPDIRTENQEFDNLTASWLEFQFGIKVEVLNNVYLGMHAALKRRISQTKPNTFDNLYIPGFSRTYDGSLVGIGFGYSVSYLIPFYKM